MKNVFVSLARQSVVALLALVTLTVVVGGLYPVAVWGMSRFDSAAAEGSFVTDGQGCRSSDLLGLDQQVPAGQADPYLHNRVAGGADDPMAPGDASASGASNLGPNSPELVKIIDTRRAVIAKREGAPPAEVPADAVTGSGSGLDPDISPAYADLQVPRIARALDLSPSVVRAIIADHTSGRQLGFLGQERVNVQQVNRDLGISGPQPHDTRCR
ncbi:potassium-transporting ATPase subunit C [Gordonia neofelifaecis]|uniref:Potassium-transporting ATPase n=1 Tax=Gordonia neofelifaecis NRRL B-59395 TaxID=644548 RepID=F1YLT6_9ACTN|nr:potassium-transporting ATPase subunit C [Gordonia neofelifaecis]EGD54480.1 Potassium-transporting ATPase [Gordonia neofelifaecis NRRL B-59395]